MKAIQKIQIQEQVMQTVIENTTEVITMKETLQVQIPALTIVIDGSIIMIHPRAVLQVLKLVNI